MILNIKTHFNSVVNAISYLTYEMREKGTRNARAVENHLFVGLFASSNVGQQVDRLRQHINLNQRGAYHYAQNTPHL